MQFNFGDKEDHFGLFGIKTKAELLLPQNVSNVMPGFPTQIGIDGNLDVDF